MTETARMSFELNEEMLSTIRREFSIEEMASRFKQGLAGKNPEEAAALAEEVFSRYGAELMRRSLQLGEEYPDRTYEVLREAIDSTGGHMRFPLLQQRFLEIAYLATQDMEYLPVIQNNPRQLVYLVEDCRMYAALEKECGQEVAATMPCRHACLSLCRTLFDETGYHEVLIDMPSATAKDGYCQFTVRRL